MADEGVSAAVLDVHLPDIDGFELSQRLRSRPQTARVPVLHLSAAFVTDEDKVRGLDAGADAYLTHPVEPAVIVASVQALVRTRVAEDAMRRSEAKFRAIYAQAPAGIGLLDEQGRFIDANPALLLLLARHADDVVGHRLTDFLPAPWNERSGSGAAGGRGADQASRRAADRRRRQAGGGAMDGVRAHRARRQHGRRDRHLAARAPREPASLAARRRTRSPRHRRAHQPHEGRLHRRAVARVAGAAERHHGLDAHPQAARRQRGDDARTGGDRAQRQHAGAHDRRHPRHVAAQPRQAAARARTVRCARGDPRGGRSHAAVDPRAGTAARARSQARCRATSAPTARACSRSSGTC